MVAQTVTFFLSRVCINKNVKKTPIIFVLFFLHYLLGANMCIRLGALSVIAGRSYFVLALVVKNLIQQRDLTKLLSHMRLVTCSCIQHPRYGVSFSLLLRLTHLGVYMVELV